MSTVKKIRKLYFLLLKKEIKHTRKREIYAARTRQRHGGQTKYEKQKFEIKFRITTLQEIKQLSKSFKYITTYM